MKKLLFAIVMIISSASVCSIPPYTEPHVDIPPCSYMDEIPPCSYTNDFPPCSIELPPCS